MTTSTVLVVEDDPSLREALSDTLELSGFDVCTATDGQHALEIIAQREIALVVSDVHGRTYPAEKAAGATFRHSRIADDCLRHHPKSRTGHARRCHRLSGEAV